MVTQLTNQLQSPVQLQLVLQLTINHPIVAGYQIEPNQPTKKFIKADANQKPEHYSTAN